MYLVKMCFGFCLLKVYNRGKVYHTHTHTLTHTHTQMYKKVKGGKVSYKLADAAADAKKLVTVSGLSEASAEGVSVWGGGGGGSLILTK